ncbi:hypothetical protein [Halomarina oriensis]|uniref:Uncharacterized protein n=1 Tax=Halomarina oriensis TaxID=671145 RepID=A0A6B0GP33_9EURY|nr:hypothetical protein [Halomarina oriensis]MWG36572.1 hypothetical protein [Halomarina oriensis]
MTARPFAGTGESDLDPEDYYIDDDFDDYALTNRSPQTFHDHFAPEEQAGVRLRGAFQPDYRVVDGTVEAQDVFTNGRLVYGPGGEAGRHEVALSSTVTTGEWLLNFRYEEVTGVDQYWFVDLVHDPATGEAIQLRGDTEFDLTLRKRYADGSEDVILRGEWQYSWNSIAVFAECRIIRDSTGHWTVATDKTGAQGDVVDPWLPSNPREIRLGSDAPPGGANTVEKQTSNLFVNTQNPYQS